MHRGMILISLCPTVQHDRSHQGLRDQYVLGLTTFHHQREESMRPVRCPTDLSISCDHFRCAAAVHECVITPSLTCRPRNVQCTTLSSIPRVPDQGTCCVQAHIDSHFQKNEQLRSALFRSKVRCLSKRSKSEASLPVTESIYFGTKHVQIIDTLITLSHAHRRLYSVDDVLGKGLTDCSVEDFFLSFSCVGYFFLFILL